TTANALTWTFYLLSRHREVERKLHGEIAEALGGRTPRVGDLDELPYTRMVIQETLRLYPPTWRLARMAVADDAFGGYRIPAGSIVVFSPYLVHRHRGFWQRPEEFDPERFAQKGSAERPRFAYFPFGGGARACIGSRFAMMEMRLILASVAGRYRLRIVAGESADPASIGTLRPRRGLMLTPQAIA
ncbi:MAG: cytochrome P450, partial [Nitrospirales bacterium]